MVFTTKYTKKKKFAGGGSVESDLVDEDGNPPSDNFRTLGTRDYWKNKKRDADQAKADKDAEGTAGRSIGEHLQAGARAVFEGKTYRDYMAPTRDPKNPLYDKRKGKVND